MHIDSCIDALYTDVQMHCIEMYIYLYVKALSWLCLCQNLGIFSPLWARLFVRFRPKPLAFFNNNYAILNIECRNLDALNTDLLTQPHTALLKPLYTLLLFRSHWIHGWGRRDARTGRVRSQDQLFNLCAGLSDLQNLCNTEQKQTILFNINNTNYNQTFVQYKYV